MYLWRKPRYRRYSFSAYIHRVNFITPRYVECGRQVYVGFNARIQGVSKYNNAYFFTRFIAFFNKNHVKCLVINIF